MLVAEVAPAHEEPDLGSVGRQVDRRLPGRIAGADQRHLLLGTQLPLQRRRPIVHARGLELVQVRDRELAIAGAAGDDHRAGADASVVGELQGEAAVGRIGREAHRFGRDRHLGSELERLIIGARHQRDAGDFRRKAEVVLDARRGAGLAAEGATVERHDLEPFGCRVDRGGEARRPRAHDGDVVDAIGIDRPHQAEAAGELDLAGIAQERPVRAQHDRELTGVDVEAFDQRPRRRIALGVEPMMRMAVAAEKAFEPQHVAILGAADDDGAAGTGSRSG